MAPSAARRPAQEDVYRVGKVRINDEHGRSGGGRREADGIYSTGEQVVSWLVPLAVNIRLRLHINILPSQKPCLKCRWRFGRRRSDGGDEEPQVGGGGLADSNAECRTDVIRHNIDEQAPDEVRGMCR